MMRTRFLQSAVLILLCLSQLALFAQSDPDSLGTSDSTRAASATETASDSTISGQPILPVDTDLDGVPDSLDLCPATQALLPVNAAGCPDTAAMLQTRVLAGLFPPGGTTLKYADPLQLDSVAAVLLYFDSLTAIIYGHTDNIGIDERNLRVSQERADAVQRYLVSRGISEDRIFSIGKGETEPIASNRTRAGRRLNRRIEIQFRSQR